MEGSVISLFTMGHNLTFSERGRSVVPIEPIQEVALKSRS